MTCRHQCHGDDDAKFEVKRFDQCSTNFNTPIARAVPDLGAVREGPYVNGKLRATGRATKF